MTHYHVGYNLSGEKPEGEVATYRTLPEAIAANHVNALDIAAGFDQASISDDTDPDCLPGTSGWVTVNDGLPGEFSYYVWAGKSEGEAGAACDCEEGEAALHPITSIELPAYIDPAVLRPGQRVQCILDGSETILTVVKVEPALICSKPDGTGVMVLAHTVVPVDDAS